MAQDSLIHADIFFFISSIALVIISIGITVLLIYLIGIVRNVREISEKVKGESGELIKDIKDLRIALRQEGIKWRHVADMIRHFFSHKEEKKKHKSSEPKKKEGIVSSIFR
ncbi:MAG TPA: hypothetical protein PLB51_02345 [Candidatus Paceibacterota bacterium]|nr:hypothetical protein [Candidatus Paceibacterota bacterium]